MLADFRDNMQKCQEYIKALEEERRKIQVFQRELPLCLELVTQAIDACKQQLSGTTTAECFNGHSECSEQTTSSNGPVLEEFIPLKRIHSPDDDEYQEHESNKEHTNIPQDSNENYENSDKLGKKSDWLRSVQLWNQTPDPPTTHEEHQPKRVSVVEVKKSGGAFQPFEKAKTSTGGNNKPTSTPAASACSSAEADDGGSGGGSKKEEKGGQAQRKARRCWSPELHSRFLHALQQLGGSHATPKQIRELMKVDGLTNDEVKSHLQKYRLHTRRPTPSMHTTTTQPPQFVVVGGIWVPAAPPEYAAAGETATVGPSTTVYTPVAAVAAPPPLLAPQKKVKQQSSQLQCEERGSHSHSEGARRYGSPATSSSTHTTTASLAC